MSSSGNALSEIREQYGQLFDEQALQSPLREDLTIPVLEIDIPTVTELSDIGDSSNLRQSLIEIAIGDSNFRPADFNQPCNIDPDEEDFGSNPRAIEERRDFSKESTTIGTEVFAIYLPFHFYPDGVWGVCFFERPILEFSKMNRLNQNKTLSKYLKKTNLIRTCQEK